MSDSDDYFPFCVIDNCENRQVYDGVCDEHTDEISDGQHTFGELYEHRAALLIALMTTRPALSWRSLVHHDGTMFPGGWFIAGMQLPTGQITYYMRVEPWWGVLATTGVPLRDGAPAYDGHRPEDVVIRLTEWVRSGCPWTPIVAIPAGGEPPDAEQDWSIALHT